MDAITRGAIPKCAMPVYFAYVYNAQLSLPPILYVHSLIPSPPQEWCHVMCHVTEDNGTRARTQDALRKVLEHTNSIVLEVKATAATGGSYMAVARKLEEVRMLE